MTELPEPRRRHARHHRSAAPRPPARADPARLHEAQPRSLAEPIRDDRAEAAAALRGQKRVRLHRGLLVEVHRARAVRGARPAARRRGRPVRDKAVLMVQSRPRHPRQGAGAYRRLSTGCRTTPRSVIAERRANPQNDLISHFSHGRDRRRPARRARGAADHHDADHGRHRIARRLHERCSRSTSPTMRDARRAVRRRPRAAGRRDRGIAALQHLGAALPPLPDEGRRAARPDHEGGRLRLPGLWLGQPRRTPLPRPRRLRHRAASRSGHLGFGGGVHACLGTAIARLAVKIAFEEFHKVVPDYPRVQEHLPWMPSSTFRSPLRLQLAWA